MNNSKSLFNKLLLLVFLPLSLVAQQDENWTVYMANFDGNPGSVLVNLKAKETATNNNLPFIVITGVTYKDCQTDGFPSKQQFNELYMISDSVNVVFSKTSNNISVGTFTYQCERLDYYYVNDTTNIRDALKKLYDNRFPSYKYYINIKEDKKWNAYLNFLYPTEEMFEFIGNQKVVLKLVDEGDNVEKERKIEHWIYFKSDLESKCLLAYLEKMKFTIESKEKIKNGKYPIQLRISRIENVELLRLSSETLELRNETKKCGGIYDGWESPVTK